MIPQQLLQAERAENQRQRATIEQQQMALLQQRDENASQTARIASLRETLEHRVARLEGQLQHSQQLAGR